MARQSQTKDPRDKVLLAALPDVAFDGWTEEVLTRACKKEKTSVAETFPNGINDLVDHFSIWADAQMMAQLTPAKTKTLRISEKVTQGVRARLEALTPWKAAVSSALSHHAKSGRPLRLPKLVWNTADKIWWAAGDTATDYNHYTKRILLSGVITTTTLFWLNDDSEGSEATWRFLDHRIADVLKIGKAISSFKKRA